MGIKVMVTGATGMVGKGVLLECLDSPSVDQVLSVGRRPLGLSHPKLKEALLADFEHPDSIEKELEGYQACYFCLGVSSAGMSEEKYAKLTFDLTVGFARTLRRLNPDMVFCYVTGAGTDGSEKGPIMWARVKGRTENEILRMGFKGAYMFRPGFIRPMRGVRSGTPLYAVLINLFRPFFPLIVALSKSATASDRVGRAMLKVTLDGCSKVHLDGADINALGA
jgi:uncharacterized protein YbjT (DUF2867 family)